MGWSSNSNVVVLGGTEIPFLTSRFKVGGTSTPVGDCLFKKTGRSRGLLSSAEGAIVTTQKAIQSGVLAVNVKFNLY
jgi:hypothetical protein